jgi:anti-anti-sigma factor
VDLEVDIVTVSGAVSVVVRGELDLQTHRRFDRAIRDALDATALTAVEIDAEKLLFVDSSGLRSLLDAAARSAACGATFSIVRPTRAVARTVEVTGVSELLGVTETN